MSSRWWGRGAASLVLTAMLAGCSGHETGGPEEGTRRFLAEADGKSYCLSEPAGQVHEFCLSILEGQDKAESGNWIHGCSEGLPLTLEYA